MSARRSAASKPAPLAARPRRSIPKGGRPLPVKRVDARPVNRRSSTNGVSDFLNTIGRGARDTQNFLKEIPTGLSQGILQGRKSTLQKSLERSTRRP